MNTNSFHDLRKRFLTSALLILLLIGLIIFADVLVVSLVIALVAVFFAFVGVWEFLGFCEKKQIVVDKIVTSAFGALVVAGYYISLQFNLDAALPFYAFALGAVVFFALRVNRINGAIAALSVQVFSLVYVAFLIGMILYVLYFPSASVSGKLWFAYLLVMAKVSDMGGYFGGRLFGKRKLAKSLSPGKTIAGAISSLVVAICGSLIFSIIAKIFSIGKFNLPILNAIILGFGLSVLGQVGDLFESLLKRDAEIKDSNQLPGLGGVLDTFDSLLFTAPALVFYLTMFH